MLNFDCGRIGKSKIYNEPRISKAKLIHSNSNNNNNDDNVVDNGTEKKSSAVVIW